MLPFAQGFPSFSTKSSLSQEPVHWQWVTKIKDKPVIFHSVKDKTKKNWKMKDPTNDVSVF